MKTCRKCNDIVPSKVEVDGKWRNLQNRTLCLTCKPFGFKSISKDIDGELKDCKHHGLTDFSKNKKGHWRCKKCCSERVIRCRRERSRYLKLFFGGKCLLCGYSRCFEALHFHHVDPSQKSFGLSQMGLARSFSRQYKEAMKCLLVCSRCHVEIEVGLIDTNAIVCAIPVKLYSGGETLVSRPDC